MTVRTIQALLLILVLSACSPLTLANELLVRDRHLVAADVSYGPTERQRLDVYAPPEASGAPVAVFFYGGSWRSGSRAGYRFVGEALARRGIVAVVADYRLYPEVGFPTFVEDAAAALAWARREIAQHGGDPDAIVLTGHSAGAHIAAMLALDPRYGGTEGVGAETIAGVVGLAGPYAVDPLRYRTIRPIFAAVTSDPDRARPAAIARAGAGRPPPFRLLHGEDDGTVSIENTHELAEALRSRGGDVEVLTYPGIGHIGIVAALYPPLAGRTSVLDDLVAAIAGLADRPAVLSMGRDAPSTRHGPPGRRARRR